MRIVLNPIGPIVRRHYDFNIVINIAIKRKYINNEEPEKKAKLIRNGDRIRKLKRKAKIFKKKSFNK